MKYSSSPKIMYSSSKIKLSNNINKDLKLFKSLIINSFELVSSFNNKLNWVSLITFKNFSLRNFSSESNLLRSFE